MKTASRIRRRTRELTELLFLGEVALLVAGLFLVAGVLWFNVLYYVVASAYAIVVLRAARRAARAVPASIPLQRPLGVVLYLSGHFLQFLWPGQLPMELVAVALIACPLAMLLLFE